GPPLRTPPFAPGTKVQDGPRIFSEPLASWDPDGNLSPNLAAEIPTLQNGGVAKDGRSVTWKLKKGVVWHGGQPFPAADCVFTAEWVADPATASRNINTYKDLKVDKVDSHTIKISFKNPTPFSPTPFLG